MASRRYLSWCQRGSQRILLLRRVPYSTTSVDSPSFQRAKRGPFFQEPPVLYNPFVEDTVLRSFLKRTLPEQVQTSAFQDFEKFGDRIVTEIDGLGRQVEKNPPSLIHYDAYGRRIDELVLHESWRRLHDVSAEEGLVSTAYCGPYKEWNRLCQMVKLYLFASSSGLYSCPLAMTDGAAKILKPLTESRFTNAYNWLTSQSPDKFWTSGQWMTERKGGSDVANGTETVAVLQGSDEHKLYGYKWFTSATDADISLTLAREQDDKGDTTPGTRGLSLFYVETRDANGGYNNLELQRLKDKLGTRQLPTAELLLDGTTAYKVSESGKGVAAISPMLTITRIHNSISAVSLMRRRRLEYGLLEDPSSGISDADLISLIRQIRMDMPYSGVSMVCGSLRARRFNITREKVRSALRSIDPLASASRWSAEITRRRPYSVAGPNSLWHIDSHHKLIRWRLITHGGIDGYSRLIVFLKCSSNNRSSTMYELFLTAVQKHQLPSRVRSDQGGENMLVAQHMIEHRGAERRSMITGSSTHNQRIERLWRDMHKSVTVLFYKLFYFMEQNDLLDHLNEIHLWALHYVFIPRINKALQEFVRSWNNHSLRTAGHKSPQQLFTAGALLLQNSQLSALDFFHQVDVNYGIDPDGPLPVSDDNDVEGVSVPETSLRFSDENMTTIRQNIDPYSYSDNYGVDLYEQTVAFISTLNPLH